MTANVIDLLFLYLCPYCYYPFIMKISYNWLKRYCHIPTDPETTARLLTSCGLEVENLEKIESVKGGLKGVVIGRVVECTRHPNADKLSLTKVDIGSGRLLSIVCGAPNVAAGQVVPVATVGAILHSGDKSLEIQEARIRGEFSEGMICAEDELGLGTSHEGIMVLDPSVPVGMPAAKYFDVTEDWVFEIGLTPNRTDATAHFGVARDLVAVINQRFPGMKTRLVKPSVDEFSMDNHDLTIPVVVEDPEACPRYSGVTMTGVRVSESPAWLKNLLMSVGIRPINNVVDVTNFILMETGQPLHAFDAARIRGGKVIVRKARQDEPFTTLDEIPRKLSRNDLMICNTEEGMCIAGVFGGMASGVTDDTTEIFLESAYFQPAGIRKTSRYHNLQTDASFRFERGADPNITVYALKRAAVMIRELAGAKISSDITDFYPSPVKPATVTVSLANVRRLVGMPIPVENIKSILVDLGVEILEAQDQSLKLSVPAFKSDVYREADIIEDILRIYGYDQVEMTTQLRSSLSFSTIPDRERLLNIISDLLAGRGFTEIMSNSLTRSRYMDDHAWPGKAGQVRLLNPLSSDLDVMRKSMVFGGLEAIAYNINRKSADLKIFEFGRTYRLNEDPGIETPLKGYMEKEYLSMWMTGRKEAESWRTGDNRADFFDLKETLLAAFTRLGFKSSDLSYVTLSGEMYAEGMSVRVHGRDVASFGRLSAKLLKGFDIRQEVYYAEMDWHVIMSSVAGNKVAYRELPKYPEVRRDLALVLDEGIAFGDLRDAAFHAEKRLLRSVSLFDIYKGDKIPAGKKSYALSFILRDDEKTLTDQVIEKTMDRILQHFREKFQATLR